MQTNELSIILDGQILSDSKKEIKDYYCGDFLSRVISKAPSDCCWFTIMANVNVAGVCVLAEISAVVLCEGVSPDAQLLERCIKEGITLIKTDLSVFECVKRVTKAV